MPAPIPLQIVFRPAMDPFDRQWFEEQLEEAFTDEPLGQVIGGGTAMDGSSSDIAIEVNTRVRGIAVVRDVLRREQAPLGTEIVQRGQKVVVYPVYDAKHPFVEPEKPAGSAAVPRKLAGLSDRPHGDLPAVGDAVLVPVPDVGVLTVCRVIRVEPAKSHPVLVTATNWFGQTPPDLTDKRLKKSFVLSYVGGIGPFRSWVTAELPGSLKKLGTIPPTRKERQLDSPFNSSWNVFSRTIASQLKWASRQQSK